MVVEALDPSDLQGGYSRREVLEDRENHRVLVVSQAVLEDVESAFVVLDLRMISLSRTWKLRKEVLGLI